MTNAQTAQIQRLDSQLQTVKKHLETIQGVASKQEMEKIAEEIWKLDLSSIDMVPLYEKFDEPQDVSVLKVHSLLESVFRMFAKVLDPSLHIHEHLFSVYTKLVDIYIKLDSLHKSGTYSCETIRHFQNKINQIENQHVFDGKFKAKQSDEEVGQGQAVLIVLLEHCHRLTRLMLTQNDPVHPKLKPIHDRLSIVFAQASTFEEDTKLGKNVDLKRIHALQQELQSIEHLQKNGKFLAEGLPETFIPDGQAELKSLLEDCHDKIYNMLTSKSVVSFEKDGSLFSDAYHLIAQVASNTLQVTKETIGNVENAALVLSKTLWEQEKEQIKNVKTSAQELLGSAFSKIQSFWRESLELGDVVDPKLQLVEQELLDVNKALKKLRVEYLLNDCLDHGVPDARKAQVEKLRERLMAIENAKVEGRFIGDDGSFAPKGQALLASLLNEAFSRLRDIELVQ